MAGRRRPRRRCCHARRQTRRLNEPPRPDPAGCSRPVAAAGDNHPPPAASCKEPLISSKSRTGGYYGDCLKKLGRVPSYMQGELLVYGNMCSSRILNATDDCHLIESVVRNSLLKSYLVHARNFQRQLLVVKFHIQTYYKVYELKAVHLVGTWKIVKLNKEILKKVNNLAKQRMEFNRMVVEGASADEREYAGRNITNLKRKILEFQAAVESGGGTAFQIPDEINDVP